MNASVDISNVTLKTPRLVLRPWRQSDLDDFYEYASVEGVGEMVGWRHHKYKDQTQEILNTFIGSKKIWCVEYQGKAVGSFTLEDAREQYVPEFFDETIRELGFILAKPLWGQGLMKEAVDAALDYLFKEVGCTLVIYGYFEGNIRAEKLMKKCGFQTYQKISVTSRLGLDETVIQGLMWKKDWLKIHP